MAVKIYWGPPGSYKTSCAIEDDVSRCAREGRVLITNVRGLSESRIREHAPDVAVGFELIHLRNDVPEELDRLRRWWHWAPLGAFLLIDEVQAVYPPDWSKAELKELDAWESRVLPNGHKLPRELPLIFDMHRHGNFDLTFTTPHISKVRKEIRAACEVAYKHKNLAIHGSMFKGRCLECQHSAEDNGNPSDIFLKRSRKVKQWVFQCYESTATGQVRDTGAGLSMLANPKLLLLLLVVLAGVGAVVFVGRPHALGGGRDDGAKASRTAVAPPGGARLPPGAAPAPVGVAAAPGPGVTEFRRSAEYRIVGVVLGVRHAYALAYSPGAEVRIPIGRCRRDEWAGWWCRHEGELITERTGRAPPREERPQLFEDVARLASAPAE